MSGAEARGEPRALRVAVVGAGAIGGYVGARMAEAGYDITLIDPWPAHVAAMRRDGLIIDEVNQPLLTVRGLEALDICDVPQLSLRRPFDVVLLSVKSYDTAWATAMIAPYLAPDGFIVSVQNCINEETIAGIAGWGRTAGCAVLFACELDAPGRIRRTVGRTWTTTSAFYLGEVHGRVTSRIESVAAMFAALDKTVVTTNLWGERWSKLVVNVMRNALSAVTGLGGNEREKNEAARRYSIGVGGEAVIVGRALGYAFDKVGRLEAEDLFRAAGGDADAFEAVSGTLLAEARESGRSDAQRPSMAQDIAKGRRTEVDWINGFIVDKAASIGLEAPLNAALTALVKDVVAGRTAPSPAVLSTLPDPAARR